MGFILIVCGIGMILGVLTARRSEGFRLGMVVLSPMIVWIGMLLMGGIESFISGVFARGIGGVLVISIGYWLFVAWAVALACFLGQFIRRKIDPKQDSKPTY